MALPDYEDFIDNQELCEIFQVFEEIRVYNEVPDVVITVVLILFDFDLSAIGMQRKDSQLSSRHFERPDTFPSTVV